MIEWKGGDVAKGPGGAHKINMMKNALKEYSDREDLIILFTDAYDVVVTGSKDEILNRFDQMNKVRDGKMKGIVLLLYQIYKILFYVLLNIEVWK